MFASVFVVLRGGDGEPLLRTPELDGDLACRAAIMSIRLNAVVRERYQRRAAAQGGRYFVLTDPWGDPLGFSPLFDSEDGCEAAIHATMDCAAHALVVRATPITREVDALPRRDPTDDKPRRYG
jgi:hypothetical protein